MILENLEGTEIFLLFDDLFKNIKGNLPVGSFVKIEALEEIDGKLFAKKFTKVDEIKIPTKAGGVVSNKLEFCEVAVISLDGKQPYEKYRFGVRGNRDNRVQCFQGETTIEISLDHEILDSFQRGGLKVPFSDLDSLISICKNFADAQWEEEQTYLTDDVISGSINLDSIKEFYEKHKGEATLRVGWGTGMLGTTVALLLEDQRRKELRNKVISADQKNRPLPAPKSRRFVLENGKPIYPLGWVQLSEVANE
jgi:CRISPR-associated protein Csm5